MTAKEFIFSLPARAPKEALLDKETIFLFDLSGDQSGSYTVQIHDGELKVLEGAHGEPKCTVRSSGENFMKVINGELKPLNALLFGKIKVDNQGELIKYAKVLGLMK